MLRSPISVFTCLLVLGVAGGAHADDELPLGFALDDPPDGIYGGTDVAPCGWPTTVSMQGQCTGTLVHPRVVVYAAHCGGGYSSVTFGERINSPAKTVQTERCSTRPGGGAGGGMDHAYCILREELTDVPIVPVLMGCETDILQPGQEVTIVGYGDADTGPYGTKREVTTGINQITSDNEAFIGGGGKDSCQGDSGGPVYVKLDDGTWRVFGITSYGGACGSGGYYSMMHIGMEWIESDSGIDITPCHDTDGTWNPGPECFQFPKEPATGGGSWSSWCGPGVRGGYSMTCGPGFNSEPDEDPPVVTITSPEDRARFDSDPGTGTAPVTINVTADDGDGWGISDVKLIIDGMTQEASADPSEPYDFSAQFPPGVYEIGAVATDYADNQGFAETIIIGVDEDPPEPEDPDTGGGTGGGTGAGDDGGDGNDDGGDDGGTGGGSADGESSKKGCGCATGSTPAPLGAFGLLLLGFARRRRR